MLDASVPVMAVCVGPDPPAGLDAIRRIFGAGLVTVPWGTGGLPRHPAHLIILFAQSAALSQLEQAALAVRVAYVGRPVLALLGTLPLGFKQIVDADVDELLIGSVSDEEIRAVCSRLLESHPADTCPAELLLRAASLNIIGRSASLLAAVARIPRLAQSESPLLIAGETGTGKELFSRAIHYMGKRAGGPFVAVNCGGLPDQLLENELFGHVKGAYTDARGDHRGMVHEAAGGTLLLDEVNSLSPVAQVKLLRFMENRRYKRVGDAHEEEADIRLICASNADLAKEVEHGGFRQDLFYRINVLTLNLPPLRDRRQDIPLLAHAFLENAGRGDGGSMRFLTREAVEAMMMHSWPGNVRELRNVVERAATMSRSHLIHSADLGLSASGPAVAESFQAARCRAIAEFERGYLARALAANGGNVTRAARYARKDRRTFQRLLSKYGFRGEG